MRYQVIWIKSAVEDLDEIERYHVEQGESSYSEALRTAIVSSSDALQTMPGRGKLLSKLGPKYHVRLHKPYRIIYEIDDAKAIVYILAVLHTSRELAKAWRMRQRKRR